MATSQDSNTRDHNPIGSAFSAAAADRHAERLIWQVCCLSGAPTFVTDIRKDLAAQGVARALRHHDTPTLYNWMVRALAYQGISDNVAHTYMEEHGSITWAEVEASLSEAPDCQKLASYWNFHRCGYSKTNWTCAVPGLLDACPLPAHTLRNGRLNQSAYGLYLFMRDIADRDFVAWMEFSLRDALENRNDLAVLREALLGPMQNLLGMSDKMLSMILSGLLIAGAAGRRRWVEVGASMIVVDTLVHNFLRRTGILRRYNSEHLYGAHCYAPGGCASIIRTVSEKLDARQFNPRFPERFPRFVQHAIWRYCAQQERDICNGTRIDDVHRCE